MGEIEEGKMALNKKEQKRVGELHREIYELEHSGKSGFCPDLIPLYKEMQELYRKQEATKTK